MSSRAFHTAFSARESHRGNWRTACLPTLMCQMMRKLTRVSPVSLGQLSRFALRKKYILHARSTGHRARNLNRIDSSDACYSESVTTSFEVVYKDYGYFGSVVLLSQFCYFLQLNHLPERPFILHQVVVCSFFCNLSFIHHHN